jgi:hypothetical protein
MIGLICQAGYVKSLVGLIGPWSGLSKKRPCVFLTHALATPRRGIVAVTLVGPVTRRSDRVSGKSGPWRGPRIGAVTLPLPPADRKLNIC